LDPWQLPRRVEPDDRTEVEISIPKKIWGQIAPLPQHQLAQAARDLETAGLEGVWAPQLFGAPFAPLAAVAMATERLKLGSGIALAFTRSPLETACNALDLDLISNGRLVLGLGSSAESLIHGAFGQIYGKPLKHMREVVAAIRAVVASGHTGELGLIEGEYHQLDLRRFRTIRPPVRETIPIYLPAVFEKACAQAGELADGLLGHPLWCDKWIDDQVSVNLKQGLDKAGRPRTAVDLNLMIFVAVNDDKAQAVADARMNVAFYSQDRQYQRYFDYIGFGREAAAIQEAYDRHDFAAMSAACSDEMVETIVIAGPADEVRVRVAQRAAVADSITPVVPHFGLSPEQLAHYSKALAETLYP
jgi:probable F420-dependent oxidoreductase